MRNSKQKFQAARRSFLRQSAALGGAAPFALNLATLGASAELHAAANEDYRALVCLFMNGGNDQANTVLATDNESWNNYQTVRATVGNESIALPALGQTGGVIPITPNTLQAGRSFALHPVLTPLQTLFGAGRLAIVSNVGPLITPTTKEQYRTAAVPLPPKLFSHNDQQSLWQSYAPEGARYGWGGRIGDMLDAMNGSHYFTTVSAAGNAVMLAGQQVKQYQISSSGAVAISGLNAAIFGLTTGNNPYNSIISSDSSNLFEKEHAAIVRRSIEAQILLANSMLPAGDGGVPHPEQYTVPSTGLLANNPLAVQLQTVARLIGGRGGLGMRRQVFYVSMGGFDTHDGQAINHPDLLTRLAHALAYFDGVLGNLNGIDMRVNVTTFTASDFGRTLTTNGDGTDHGWGSHHFVMGGAVKGGDIYGTFPATSLGHSQDVGSGSLLPQFSVDQYAGTLAKWMGLSDNNINDIFPNLTNFTTRDLGFML